MKGSVAAAPQMRRMATTPAKSYAELQERLRAKLEEFRSKRQEQNKSERTKQAKEWRNSVQNKKTPTGPNKTGKAGAGRSREGGGGEGGASASMNGGKSAADNLNAAQADVNFNQFDFTGIDGKHQKESAQHRGKRSKKEQLLKAAEMRNAALQEAGGADTQQGKDILMKSALARARGEKVYDDPKLLRRSMKRDSKLKERSAKKWEERLAAQKDAADHRQGKRSENLKRRAEAKIERRKQKRLKKLLRPGFEGRKEGFING